MGFHVFASVRAKKTCSLKRRKISDKTLDCDSRKWDSQTAKIEKGASGTSFRGPFSFAALLLVEIDDRAPAGPAMRG
jgi:hypothetical protein